MLPYQKAVTVQSNIFLKMNNQNNFKEIKRTQRIKIDKTTDATTFKRYYKIF